VTRDGPPGVPAERTDLAWQRTGLGILAVAGLIGHRAVGSGRPALLVVAGVTALAGLGVLGGLAPARARFVRRRRIEGADVSARRSVTAVTAAVVAICLAAAVAVTVPAD
jgi:putative membrane protein